MQQRRARPLLLAAVLTMLGCGLSVYPRGGNPAPADAGATGGGGADAYAPGTGPPTLGAAGLEQGGRPVPRNKAIVLLHIGHSNMAGRARAPESERPYFYDIHPQLWMYARGGQFRPAREPTSPDSMTQGRAGPGMAILRNGLTRAPDALMISIGHGHTGPDGGFCRSYRKGGLLYDIVMVPAMELRGKVTFGAIFNMFGTSEVNDTVNNSRVGECLEGIAREMRADLGDPDIPFVVGGWEQARTDLGPDSEAGQIIIPQLTAVPMRIPRAVLIPTEGLPIMSGDHHYDMTGHRLWAERGFQLLATARLLPWAITP